MRFRRQSIVVVAAATLIVTALSVPARGTLSPPTNTLTIAAGSSGTEVKTVGVPETPPMADIEIAIDTTGSMGGVIDQAKAQAQDTVDAVQAQIPDAQFAVVDFKDSEDPVEYAVLQSMTADGTQVKNAIDTMFASGGGDLPEAYNLVFHNSYTPDVGGAIGWRNGSRKFVVVFGDAPPHGAANDGYDQCFDTTTDPHGLHADVELAGMNAAQRTLFMIASGGDGGGTDRAGGSDRSNAATSASSGILPCYQQLAADAYTGSTAVNLGDDIATQLVELINDATSTVGDVHLEVTSAAPPPATASWISFSPASAGPVTPPVDLTFIVTVAVPPGTPPATYDFDIVALADGADIGHQALHIIVPGGLVGTRLVATAAIARVLPPAVYFPELSARLTQKGSGSPIPGKEIAFSVRTLQVGQRVQVCSATTNQNGVASCGGVVTEVRVALGLGYTARFNGDGQFGGAADQAPLIQVVSRSSSADSSRSSESSYQVLTIHQAILWHHLRPEPGWIPVFIGQP